MILVRNVFQVKFGKMKDVKELWKEGLKLMTGAPPRLLTDLTGQFYTLVMESTYKNLADLEHQMETDMRQSGFGAWYQKLIPLVESGRREIFNIEELK